MKHSTARRQYAFLATGVLMACILTGTLVNAQRPRTIHLKMDGQVSEVYTDKATLGEALSSAGFDHLEDAKTSVDFDAPVEEGMQVDVQTRKTITLLAAGKESVVETYAARVDGLLAEQNIDPDADDFIRPARSSQLEDGETVEFDAIERKIDRTETPIPYTTKTEETEDLKIGDQQVITKGEDGKRLVRTEIVIKNGVEESRKVLSDEVIKKPVEEVVRKGTYDPTPRSPILYSLSDFHFHGVIYYEGYKYTYYSQSVLPGTGLDIPGRHVNDDGFVVDGDGYIVLAGSADKGTVFPTPFGADGKIYDRGTTGNHLDVYVQ